VAAGRGARQLTAAGFDAARPAVVASTGVVMYLSRDAIAATLRQVAALAPGSTLALSFIVPIELALPEERAAFEASRRGAQASGTPFVSFFAPAEMESLARDAGFREVSHVAGTALAERYFANRSDGLRTGNAEAILVART
jgi:O-methyltransferase involved in polyketide biosynthesis